MSCGNRILVSVEQDRMGCLTIRPVSERWRRKIVRHLVSMKAVEVPEADDHSVWAESCRDGSVFLQADYDVEAFLEDLPPRHRRDVREGWTVKVYMGTWTFLSMVGYDAAEAL